MNTISQQTQNRFWSKVNKTRACWIWTGARTTNGYGQFKYNGRPILAHRFAFMLANDRDPGDCYVLHACDNPACVRPDHLCEGTHLENMQDRSVRMRAAKKLSADRVRKIRKASGTHRQIAARYNVSHTTVGHIKRRETWAFI